MVLDEANGIDVVGLLSHPTGGASGNTPLSHLVEILLSRPVELHVITGSEGAECLACRDHIHVHPVRWRKGDLLPITLLRYLLVQLRASLAVARLGTRVSVWIFFIDGQNQVLPFLLARILRRPVILIFAFSAVETLRRTNPGLAFAARVLSTLSCSMAQSIMVYSPRIIDEYQLRRWDAKIASTSPHFVDIDQFKPDLPLSERNLLIGYIGRFAEEKGVLRLVEALPAILRGEPEVKVALIGDGPAKPRVEAYLHEQSLEDSVVLVPWIDHCRLPALFNRMRLLVIPSYTEGLPNAMLESMACGTPVIATPVGAIPDVIDDRQNGFLFTDIDPEGMAAGILDALHAEDLKLISVNGRRRVEDNYTFDRAAARLWRLIDGSRRQDG